MDELSLKLETIIKRFNEGEIKGTFFCSDTDSQTLLTVAKQLNVPFLKKKILSFFFFFFNIEMITQCF